MKISFRDLLGTAGVSILAVILVLIHGGANVQAQQPAALVIEGGTLVDGNGGVPVSNSVVVIQGNRIAAVGRKGQTTYPPNSQVINADGKFVIPGLWDAHSYGTWFLNDFYVNNGVTSLIDNGLGGELSIIHKEAVNRGRIAGPRYVISIGSQSNDPRFNTGFEPLLFPDRIPKSPADARVITKRFVDAGADFIFFQDAALPLDVVAASVDEAKKAGKPIALERVGNPLTLMKAVEMGFNYLTHSPGVAEELAKDPSKWKNELDLYADMDPAKAQALIKTLVDHKVTLVPNFINIAPGYQKDFRRFEEEDARILRDPDVLSFYPEATVLGRPTALGLLRSGTSRSQLPTDPAVLERRRQGYRNLLKFHLDFLHAGGRVLTGGNTQVQRVAGMTIQHEMEAFVEGGFSTMETLQAATKWAAESMHLQDRVGTIEDGRLADLLILNGDPLQDIRNTQKIDMVVFNGKVTERKYHSWPSDPFMDSGDIIFGNPPVESLAWVVALKKATGGGGGGEGEGAPTPARGMPNPPASPQPAIETISPTLLTEGAASTTITVKGFNFVRRMQVLFNGKPVPYKGVNPTEIQVTLDETLLRTPGKFDLVIKNPPPVATPDWGNGTSNTAHLLVNFKY